MGGASWARPLIAIGPGKRMLPAVDIMKSSMSKAGLDTRHRNKNGEISRKHGNILIGTSRKTYGEGFATGYLQPRN